jgi:hypothetical protein
MDRIHYSILGAASLIQILSDVFCQQQPLGLLNSE